jgi:hypothetical protein
MRDYEVIVYATADPSTGVEPEHLRYLFTHCVRATITTTVRDEVWACSLDERLLDYEQYAANDDLDGYVWGVNWHKLYPGARMRSPCAETEQRAHVMGIPLHEVVIETNAHHIELVFSELRVSEVPPGYAPVVIQGDGPDAKFPLA